MHIQVGQIAPHTVQHDFSKCVLLSCFSQVSAALLHNARIHLRGTGRTWQDLTQGRRDCRTDFSANLCITMRRKLSDVKCSQPEKWKLFHDS